MSRSAEPGRPGCRRVLRTARLCAVLLLWGCATTDSPEDSGRGPSTDRQAVVCEGPVPRAPTTPSRPTDGWEETARVDGVVASSRRQEGAELPVLRAVGRVGASIYEVFAVIQDAERHTEWIYRCAESTVLDRRSKTEGILYNRVRGLPPIVADRDVVLAARASRRLDGREILIEFESIESPLKSEVDGVVRMPKMSGHYRLTAISESCTEIEYQVHADPGGWLFDWIKRAAIRALPLRTVLRLRQQVERTRGQYASSVDAASLKRR